MGIIAALLVLPLLCAAADNAEVGTLMELKYSLDPRGEVLSSWTENGDPCGGEFLGIGCNQAGRVANISLQGKELSGSLSPAISELLSLSGVFLHYNSLTGEIPPEISKLTSLSDLYLNVNNLSGGIPPEIGNMAGLQVLQLGYNQLTGSIPTQLGLLKNLSALALQSNQLTGAIPASLGDLTHLSRLDLSYNQLFGSIPGRLAQVSGLSVLDLRSNSLSGNVPSALKKLGLGFRFENNKDLCGVDFDTLRACGSTDLSDPVRPEPYSKTIPQSANIKPRCDGDRCSIPTRSSPFPVIGGVIAAAVAVAVAAGAAFAWHVRRQNTPSPEFPSSQKDTCRKSTASPLISLEYSNGWDPLSDGRSGGGFSQEVSQNFRFNLEEVESATQYFADVNLLGKSGFAATFKGILRDGSVVAVKSISKNSCRSEEAEFLKGLKLLTSLDHENLVSLRGFCCSRGRGECFLVYDFVANGSLAQYLDSEEISLDWPKRVAIVKGIARGIDYLHTSKGLVHQNISARKILIDHHFKPLISGSGLQKLLADDVVFSSLKASAAMGYLAPEYTTTGRFTEKSDVYAFGVLLLQILSGKRKVNHLRFGVDSGKIEDLIDGKLEGNYSKQEAAKLAGIALFCTSENIEQRPTMAEVLLELGAAVG